VVDDRLTEPNEQFRIELTDSSGRTFWGAAEPNRSRFGFVAENPTAAVFTIHDTERDCATPGAGSGYTLSTQVKGNSYWLVVEEPEHPQQCAYVAWRYIDDNLPDPEPHHDADWGPQGLAYFSSDENSAALGGYQQWFDLSIPVAKQNVGGQVRIAWALGSDRPAIATLKLPEPPLMEGPNAIR